ncbi:MAG: nucleotidyltransferase domain-containing protein [Fibromonadales bacterium]|nr:nucleotidyltransferase domain-containing protein [Fibromonadales bacterium]
MSIVERNWHLIEKMTERLKELKPYKVILFGSYAKGNPTEDSDLDVVVILDSNDFVKSFTEKMERKKPIVVSIRDIRYQIPMDVKVYSKAEYSYLEKQDNFFINEINETGRVLYEKRVNIR